ncbi:hypothetical protein H920_06064 [Fukomys damarensis]|uniref:Uncharacterized protein n=1 Tax=Fukomys damarensis TaxID=885580 RepID=A0A091DPU9_FUKDA|nr:hypothetical protein H920_06064 [Fukomys damarensis]
MVHVNTQQSESSAGSTPSHTVRFTDLNIEISLNSGTYVLKWSSGFGIYDYRARKVKLMCKLKSTGRVSTTNKKKQLQINILGEKSTTVDTRCQNTGDKYVRQQTHVVALHVLTSSGAHQCLRVNKQQCRKNETVQNKSYIEADIKIKEK